MEALTAEEVPTGPGWQYEPKWDGFRCLARRNGARIELTSKSGQPLARYFPELVAAFAHVRARRFLLDGEIVAPSFDDLLSRIHPAASRIAKLARETPARFVAFDLLEDGRGELAGKPLGLRRRRLEAFAKRFLDAPSFELSPATTSRHKAVEWLRRWSARLDGIVAKRLEDPYHAGERAGMVKVKRHRTAECVVGGFRYSSAGQGVGSLLLGLFDADGLLHHVGFTTVAPRDRERWKRRLEPLRRPPGFTGKAPGGPSRWSRGRSTEWEPLNPILVVEIEYDHVSDGRFRHGTRLLRERPDKPPERCTLDQIVKKLDRAA